MALDSLQCVTLMKNRYTVKMHCFIVCSNRYNNYKHNEFIGKFTISTPIGEAVLSHVVHRRTHLFDSHAQYHPP